MDAAEKKSDAEMLALKEKYNTTKNNLHDLF